MKYTLRRHLLRHAPSAIRLSTPTTRCGSSGGGPVVGWVNTKVFDETGDAAKSQGWTAFVLDTNGNGKRDAYVEPGSAGRSDEGQADQRRLLRGDAAPDRRLDLGLVRGATRARSCASCPGSNPPETALVGSLQRAGARLRRARRRHRQEGRRLGVARQRPSGQLRSQQVQGSAQRPEGDRRSLSGRLDVLPVSGPGLRGHRREQRRGELLHLGRSAQHVRPRRGRADVDRQSERRARLRSRTAR